MRQNNIIQAIESSVRYLAEHEKNGKRLDFGFWEELFRRDTARLIDKSFRIDADNLTNFRGKQLFVVDHPNACLRSFYSGSKFYYKVKSLMNKLVGNQRGKIREAIDFFRGIKDAGFLDLLEKYPNSDIGKPLNLRYKGYSFTWRYLRHIYFLGLFKEYLQEKLREDAVIMDIGSSYGIFSGLIKQDMLGTHHVLVDAPGQLILAHYYLSQLHPGSKIAGFQQVGEADRIDKDFIERYDFVLVPTAMYDKLAGHSVDLVTNFASFSEMSREWFNAYINSAVFKTSPFLYTINRYDAYPTYDNNITVLDYPLKDYKAMHMRTCPLFKNHYQGYLFLWYKAVRYPSELFEFIGKRINV